MGKSPLHALSNGHRASVSFGLSYFAQRDLLSHLLSHLRSHLLSLLHIAACWRARSSLAGHEKRAPER
mgnify:CR=1 FL=1